MIVKVQELHWSQKNTEMNGVQVKTVSQMTQLVINYFEAKIHTQKNMKQNLMRNYWPENS